MTETLNLLSTVGYLGSSPRVMNEGKENEHTYFALTSDPYKQDSVRSVIHINIIEPELRRMASQLSMGMKVCVSGYYEEHFAYLFGDLLHTQKLTAFKIEIVKSK